MDTCWSPFKRRFIENWRKEVNKHLRAGTMCKIVTDNSFPSVKEDETKDMPAAASNVNASHEISTQTSPRMNSNSKQQKVRFAHRMPTMESQDRKSDLLQEGVQSNGIRKSSHRAFYYRHDKNKNNGDNNKMNNTDEEPTPLVIIDPQLITPVRNYEINTADKVYRPKNNERTIHNPFKFSSIQKSQDSQYKNKEMFVRCQIQSRDRNSFVVSRSNLIKYTNVSNHSFLSIPSRFQTDKQINQQTTQEAAGTMEQPMIGAATLQRRSQNSMFAVYAW